MASEVLFNVSMKNMNLQELMTRIQLPEEAQQEVFEYLLNESDYLNWKEIFYKDAQGFWEKWKMTENHFQWILSFYLQLVCEVYEEYQKQKINDQIFNDTFFILQSGQRNVNVNMVFMVWKRWNGSVYLCV